MKSLLEHISMCVIGAPGSGRSSFLHRFVENEYTESYLAHVGVEWKISTIRFGNSNIKIQLWDFSCSSRWAYIGTGCDGEASKLRSKIFLITIDVTVSTALQETKKILENQRLFIHQPKLMLIATKVDSFSRVITSEEIELFAQENNIETFIETSSKSNLNIDEAIYKACSLVDPGLENLKSVKVYKVNEDAENSEFENFKKSYYARYNSNFFKNPFSTMKRRLEAGTITSMEDVKQYVEAYPNSRSAKICLNK